MSVGTGQNSYIYAIRFYIDNLLWVFGAPQVGNSGSAQSGCGAWQWYNGQSIM